MKKFKYFISLFAFFALAMVACDDDNGDIGFVNTDTAPTDVTAAFNVSQDNSGVVTITPSGTNVVSYEIYYGDDATASETITAGSAVEHTYAEGSYTVKVVAISATGKRTEVSLPLDVSFNAPSNLVVEIENDQAVSKKVNVTAEADDAITYEVDFGDGTATPTSANIGESVSHVYDEAGTYTITVTAKGAAIETTTYTEVVEATVLQQPTTSASTPRSKEADVISIFCDKYTDLDNVDYNPNWGQTGTYSAFDLNGDAMLQYVNMTYQGIDYNETIDVSGMEYLHIDIWTADAESLETFLISKNSGEKSVVTTLTKDTWTSVDIPLSDFTDQGLSIDDIFQFKFVGAPWEAGTFFIDNLYFWKEGTEPFDDGLLDNGDFEAGSESWIQGVDDATPVEVTTADGNTYFSVNVTAAGNPWDVNMSQKVAIEAGETYTLSFDAWSDVTRSIRAGIGLSADPWSSAVEDIDITTSRTTYTLTLVAEGFGADDARVIFDLGAAAGMVNIDNVSLVKGDGTSAAFDSGLLTSGDFESDNASWIQGVDDAAPVEVTTADGNTYFSVNVTAAGNPYDVNMSQKVAIEEDATYTLTFDAWSDTERGIVAGIGLSASPWTNVTETVAITTTQTTYTLTLTATGFGADDARVIFDLGAEVGVVNIDNVSLVKN